MRPTGTAEQLEARRMIAGRMFALGKSNPETAAVCGVSVAAVKIWKRAWREKGEAGLAAKRHPGARPRLDESQLVELEKLLLHDRRPLRREVPSRQRLEDPQEDRLDRQKPG